MRRLVILTVCTLAFAAAGSAQGGSRSRVQGETGAQRAGTAQREINEYGGEKGISSVGGTVGYGVDGKTVLVGVDYRYNIRDRIRLAPSVLYLLENDYRSTLYVNADVHYLARVAEKITMYPVGGLGLSVWNIDIPVPVIPVPLEENDILPAPEAADSGASETKVRIGLNLGFGAEMRVTKDVIIGAEFRYNLTSERIYDQAMFLARAAYYF